MNASSSSSGLARMTGNLVQFLDAIVPPWERVRVRVVYVVRTVLAIGLALWMSYALQLSSPLSSVTTVLIVANPVVGALISKSFWRILGTTIGAVTAVVMMAFFAQAPVLFTLVLAVLIGVACCVATLLRFFKAYAAVLAGYTVVIVSSSALADPDGIFLSAVSRFSAVAVGLISTALVFLLTNVSQPTRVFAQVDTVLRDVVALFSRNGATLKATGPAADEGETGEDFRAISAAYYGERGRLLAQAAALNEAIEYASADNFDVRRRAAGLRRGVAGMLGLVCAYRPHWQSLPTRTEAPVRSHNLVAGIMARIVQTPPARLAMSDQAIIQADVSQGIEQLDQLIEETGDLYEIALIDSDRQVLEQLRNSVDDLNDTRRRNAGLGLFFEWPSAFRNGARGAFITFTASLFWYIWDWNQGPTMLGFLIPASCLLATSPSATRAAMMFGGGTMLAILGSYLLQTFFLPRIDGFPLLWLSLTIFLIPGMWFQFHPRYSMAAFGYVVFLTGMSHILNPIQYEDLSLMNGWYAFLIAAALLIVVFRVVLPSDQRLDCGRLIMSLCAATEHLATMRSLRHFEWVRWENLQMQKILRLVQRASFAVPPPRAHEITDAAFVAVALGRSVVRLRTILRDNASIPQESRVAVQGALGQLGHVRNSPSAAANAAYAAAVSLLSHLEDRNMSSHVPTRRAAACLLEISFLVNSVPGFFDRKGPMQRPIAMMGADRPLGEAVRDHAGLMIAEAA